MPIFCHHINNEITVRLIQKKTEKGTVERTISNPNYQSILTGFKRAFNSQKYNKTIAKCLIDIILVYINGAQLTYTQFLPYDILELSKKPGKVNL